MRLDVDFTLLPLRIRPRQSILSFLGGISGWIKEMGVLGGDVYDSTMCIRITVTGGMESEMGIHTNLAALCHHS